MSPKSGADEPRFGAPSPADNPTTPQRPAAGRDHPTRPSDPDAPRSDRTPGTLTPGSKSKAAPEAAPATDGGSGRISPGRTRVGGTWIGFILGALVLIFLLVFIVQNLVPIEVTFLGLRGTLPLGIWLLFAAIAGVLLLAVPGLGRLIQWRRATKRAGK